ncbi:MAG: hypothetical protein ACYSUM_20240 [Planctomycetota bacterium]
MVREGAPPPEPTAAEQLQEVLDWAAADGSPMAIEVQKKAQAVLRRPSDSETYREGVSLAWTHAQAATRAGLGAQEKERLWTACASELTHGAGG